MSANSANLSESVRIKAAEQYNKIMSMYPTLPKTATSTGAGNRCPCVTGKLQANITGRMEAKKNQDKMKILHKIVMDSYTRTSNV